MDVQKIVKEFLSFTQNEKPQQNDLNELITLLDKLALSTSTIVYKFDETNYPAPPEIDSGKIREKVEKKFPEFGFYNVVDDFVENIGDSEILVGDAIDDISDIVHDLEEVVWCFENTSKDDALWTFEFSFNSHWGKHLRDLQLYLHYKKHIGN